MNQMNKNAYEQISMLWDKHRQEIIYPRQSVQQILERLHSALTIEEIPLEQADPIFIRMTKHNFSVLAHGRSVTDLHVYAILRDEKSEPYYRDSSGFGKHIIVFEQTENLITCTCNPLEPQLLIWQGIDACDCRLDNPHFFSYLMYLEVLKNTHEKEE